MIYAYGKQSEVEGLITQSFLIDLIVPAYFNRFYFETNLVNFSLIFHNLFLTSRS